jgi:hypothetical protein
MTGASLADRSNLGISSAPAVFDILGHVAKQSEWISMTDIDPSPIPGRSYSPSKPPPPADMGKYMHLINLRSRRHEMCRMHPAT